MRRGGKETEQCEPGGHDREGAAAGRRGRFARRRSGVLETMGGKSNSQLGAQKLQLEGHSSIDLRERRRKDLVMTINHHKI